jgi:predicted RNA polymerase sigma factor
MQDRVFDAIEALPEHQRTTVTLFYIDGYSQEEISSFLEIPVGTVKARLHTARRRLKERMIAVIQENLPQYRPSRDGAFTQEVMNLFKATIEGDTAQVRALLAEDTALANATSASSALLCIPRSCVLHIEEDDGASASSRFVVH